MLENKIEENKEKTKETENDQKIEEKCVWKFYAINYWNKESPVTQKCLECDTYDKNCQYYKPRSSLK
ncbi:MAG: hypothetical protein QXK80_00280 [Candidatus Pacearchaeota archaeon]